MYYSQKISFVLSPEEKRALAALAREDSSSKASVLRRLVRRAAKERALWASSQDDSSKSDAVTPGIGPHSQSAGDSPLPAQEGSDR